MNNLYKKLFNFDINDSKKIYISKNEIYNQALLYMFFSCKKSILLVVPTLNEATEIYNEIKCYIDDIFLFPEDDFMTKKAIASSPEMLFMRSNLLNKFSEKSQKIIIVHLNSFIKKIPSLDQYQSKTISLKVGDTIDRDDLAKYKLDVEPKVSTPAAPVTIGGERLDFATKMIDDCDWEKAGIKKGKDK